MYVFEMKVLKTHNSAATETQSGPIRITNVNEWYAREFADLTPDKIYFFADLVMK